MKKALSLGLVVLLVIGSTAVAYAKAQKRDLRANPPRCDVPGVEEPVAGFAILNNANQTDEVVVVVSLKDGVPGRTYAVYLEDYKEPAGGPGKWKAYTYLGLLTANIQGKGNFHFREYRDPATYYLQVVVCYPWGSGWANWGAESFGTDIATVTIK